MAEERSHLKITEAVAATVVHFEDRKILDELSISEIEDELLDLVNANPGLQLLLSFHEVEHLSSAALGTLITLNKAVRESGGAMKLSDISPQIFEVFKITRLNKLFDIHNTEKEALAAF